MLDFLGKLSKRQSVPIPEGCLRIARRFNAGYEVGKEMSPEGTADAAEFSRPFGT